MSNTYKKPHSSPLIATATVFLLIGSLMTLSYGETPWKEIWKTLILRMQGESDAWNPLLDERLPRLIVLVCTGAALASSGAIMQALFHNPLASPSVLGISSGGCLAVVLVFAFHLRYSYPYALPLAAFSGSFITLCVVYNLARWQGGRHLTNLILTGIAVSTLLIAMQGLILYSLRDHWQMIQTITEWEAGSTIDRSWQHVHMQLPLTLAGLWGCWSYRAELNLLSLGEEEAANLGVDVSRVRWRLFLSISLLTGGALAAVGMIAFFGLVLPHIIRRLQGPDHLTLIPACMAGGAAALTILDFSLRFFDWYNVSIGNLSAIIGGFFFLFLLLKPHRSRVMHAS